MKIECPGCHKIYNIPDARLPIGRKIAFPCPKCKARIQLDLRSKKLDDVNSSKPAISKTEQPDKSAPSINDTEKPLRGADLKMRILQNLKELPSMPQVVIKAQEVMGNQKAGAKELAAVLETDQAIATYILKIANSAYYGLSGKISSIQHASVMLGYKTLEEIITVAGSSKLLDKILKGYDLSSGDLWHHSLAVAFGSRIIAKKSNPNLEKDSFSAGLIHDIGKLMLNEYVFERKENFEEFMEYGKKAYDKAEKHIFGFDHAEIGYEICKYWHIPSALCAAIRYHHNPFKSQGHDLAYIVYMANIITHIADSIETMSGIDKSLDVMMYMIDDRAMEFLNFKQEDISDIMDEITESMEKMKEKME